MTSTQRAKEIQSKVEAALRPIFGTALIMNGGTIDGPYVTLKVTLPIGDAAVTADALRTQFNDMCLYTSHGLVPSDFDLPLRVNGQPARLVEIKTGRSKYPFTVDISGRRYKVGPDTFLIARARAAKPAA